MRVCERETQHTVYAGPRASETGKRPRLTATANGGYNKLGRFRE